MWQNMVPMVKLRHLLYVFSLGVYMCNMFKVDATPVITGPLLEGTSSFLSASFGLSFLQL